VGFFDKLKEQASSLGAQIDDAIKGTKTSSSLNALQKQREERVKQMGEMVIAQFRSGALNEQELRPYADQVFELERQIIQVQQEIEAQKQAAAQARMAPPPAPGTIPPPPPPGAESAMETATCPSCGTAVPEGAAFCPNCGGKVS
jgi:DNA repair exonuclease SbcCD ATPase subunit